MAHVVVATDNFNRANASSLGANWTNGPAGLGNHSAGILTNQATNNTGSANCLEFWNANSFNANHYAQATLVQLNSGLDDFSGVVVRASTSDYVIFQADSANGRVIITWYNAGAFTLLATDGGSTGDPTGKVMLLEASGQTFTAYLNGTQVLQATNASAPSTGSAGISLSGTNANASLMDDWEGGNLGSNTANFFSFFRP